MNKNFNKQLWSRFRVINALTSITCYRSEATAVNFVMMGIDHLMFAAA